MSKMIVLLFMLSVSANYIFSKDNNKDSSTTSSLREVINVEQLRRKLESGESVDREKSFTERIFRPYFNGDWIEKAVSYGCYRKGQSPGKKGPCESEVFQDLTIISKYWKLIRVYSSDDETEQILQVINKNNLPIRVMLGIWLENEEDNPVRKRTNIEQVLRGIVLANKYTNVVVALNVGNETQVFWSGHKMSSKSLIKYIRFVRNNTTIPVSTADDYNFWNKPESKIVAGEIDFIVLHMYPLWNGKTLGNAINWMNQVYDDIQKAYPEKHVIIGETGWATNYNSNKKGPDEQGTLIKGEVSLNAQEKFLKRLYEWADKKDITTFLFEAFDESWKGGGENSSSDEIEKHWGLFYEDRTPKESFINYIR